MTLQMPRGRARGFGVDPAVAALAAKGRRGDTTIAHLTPDEIVVPPSVQKVPGVSRAIVRGFAAQGMSPERYTVGPAAGVNPETGAPEFAPIDDLTKQFNDAYLAQNKDVDDAIKGAKVGDYWYGKSGLDHFNEFGRGEGRVNPLAQTSTTAAPTTTTAAAQAAVSAPTPATPGGPSAGVPGLPTPIRPTALPKPAEANVNFDESAASNLNTMLDADSPYLERARGRAMGFANSRGLVNSSIAGTAGEAAAIDAAAPIAMQDASTAAARNLSDQTFRQTQAMAAQGFDYDDYMQDKRVNAESTLSDQTFRQNRTLQSDEITSREKIAAADVNLRRFLGSLDASTRTSLAGIEDSRLRELANLQIGGQDRNAAMTAVLNIERTVQDAITAINNNPNIPAEARAEMIRSANLTRDAQMSLIEQMYNVDLVWPAAA